MGGASCGCNAALSLTSMRQNTDPSMCDDYYCDSNHVCGIACDEINIREANLYAWHSTLHTSDDPNGVGGGYGGGGPDWNGPRDWGHSKYGLGSSCVDTAFPFQVEVSFPVDAQGSLVAMQVQLSQNGHSCPLVLRLGNYTGMAKLSESLAKGMTPVLSYWS